ncbi:hypothetical protein NDU88_011383 [Pleurodeles waltl]|uniref:Uncharacterized protein n=1 Tax=Pleurodeles waltl TaxID=8319 RepID=A0AAV7Q1K1_PLEWA|nr:hypothetical protein NDU88_011383 [Pleurodeles waltl]
MADYNARVGDDYCYDDPAGSFEYDLVYALEAGVRHTVNKALAKAIRPVKRHLLGFAEQQGWIPSSRPQGSEASSLFQSTHAPKGEKKTQAADFESLVRSLAKDHNYSTSSFTPKTKARDDSDCSVSAQTSDQGDDPPCKRKKKMHHS